MTAATLQLRLKRPFNELKGVKAISMSVRVAYRVAASGWDSWFFICSLCR